LNFAALYRHYAQIPPRNQTECGAFFRSINAYMSG
jgi:hypothetical protein